MMMPPMAMYRTHSIENKLWREHTLIPVDDDAANGGWIRWLEGDPVITSGPRKPFLRSSSQKSVTGGPRKPFLRSFFSKSVP
jgi:hypothetical protein